MPTVLVIGPYRFIFFSSDAPEPVHIHVRRDKQLAKFWLEPISLAKDRGFNERELRQIAQLVIDHQQDLVEAWHDYFGT